MIRPAEGRRSSSARRGGTSPGLSGTSPDQLARRLVASRPSRPHTAAEAVPPRPAVRAHPSRRRSFRYTRFGSDLGPLWE